MKPWGNRDDTMKMMKEAALKPVKTTTAPVSSTPNPISFGKPSAATNSKNIKDVFQYNGMHKSNPDHNNIIQQINSNLIRHAETTGENYKHYNTDFSDASSLKKLLQNKINNLPDRFSATNASILDVLNKKSILVPSDATSNGINQTVDHESIPYLQLKKSAKDDKFRLYIGRTEQSNIYFKNQYSESAEAQPITIYPYRDKKNKRTTESDDNKKKRYFLKTTFTKSNLEDAKFINDLSESINNTLNKS